MKNKYLFITTVFFLAVVLGGCTTANISTSWPGLNASSSLAYVSFGNYVYAVKIKDGTLAWQYPQQMDRDLVFFAPPAVEADLLVVGDYTKNLHAVNNNNGLPQWVFSEAKDKYVAGALIYGQTIYAPNGDGYLYALDTDGKLLWKFRAKNANWSKPVTDGNVLYFSSMDHHLYALKLKYLQDEISADEEGLRFGIQNPLWSVDLGSAIFADPVLSNNGSIYVATLGGKIYSIDSQNGNILWSYPQEGTLGGFWASPWLVVDTLYAADQGGKVYALNSIDGEEVWSTPFDAGSPVIAGGLSVGQGAAFITTDGKYFTFSNREDIVQSAQITESAYTLPLLVEGRIILAAVGKEFLLTTFNATNPNNLLWKYNPSEN
jgi:outer membrane protein assembly factor BamB